MIKTILIFLLLAVPCYAEMNTLIGLVADNETGEPIKGQTVIIYKLVEVSRMDTWHGWYWYETLDNDTLYVEAIPNEGQEISPKYHIIEWWE